MQDAAATARKTMRANIYQSFYSVLISFVIHQTLHLPFLLQPGFCGHWIISLGNETLLSTAPLFPLLNIGLNFMVSGAGECCLVAVLLYICRFWMIYSHLTSWRSLEVFSFRSGRTEEVCVCVWRGLLVMCIHDSTE